MRYFNFGRQDTSYPVCRDVSLFLEQKINYKPCLQKVLFFLSKTICFKYVYKKKQKTLYSISELIRMRTVNIS